MKIKEILFNLGRLSPFSTTIIIPKERVRLSVESTEENLRFNGPVVHENGRVEIPTGASATVSSEIQKIVVKDWRRRPNHAPGASVTGKVGKINLDKKRPEMRVPGLGWVIYEG